jgi:hypothetical protein
MKITLQTGTGKVLASYTIETKRDYSQFEDAFSHLRHYQCNYNHPPGSSREKAALKVRAFAEQVCKASSDLYPDWFNDLPD